MPAFLQALTSDEALMQRYQRGDAAAFETLYGRHKNRLFAFLHRSHVDPAVTEELAQETWLAVINAAEGYRPTARFRTYLYAIAHRKLVDYWRRNKLDSRSDSQDADGADLVDLLEGEKATWTDDLDLSMDLLLALESLSKEQQQAFLLKEEGFSRSEIAVMMDAPEETIKSRIRYASNRLRHLLGVQYAD